ncbi:MAG: magnesium/cobalt transporter CorA [Planctomycetota bacterium]|nr:magnesium/cobalt transporter CorA [Planctomycetota bacterium]
MIQAFHLPKDAKAGVHLTDPAQILDAFRQKNGLLWIDFNEPTPEETNLLADGFAFHPVAVDACREVVSQPLVHSYESYLFMVIHAVNIQARGTVVDTLEVDIFWGRNFVLTYHTVPVKSIADMLGTCSTDCPILLSRGADFLTHAIVDRIIDNFSPTLDRIEYLLEELEIQIFQRPTDALLHRLLDLKQTVAHLGRIATAQRDVVGRLLRGEFAAITRQAMAYWLDAYDHLVRMAQITETQRDLINTARDTYMSVVSNRTNAIMKLLTFITTVFMPLTFLTGMYGMNFVHMPPKDEPWGFYACLGAMFLTVAGMVWFFKRRKWI